MHIISRKALVEFWDVHEVAKGPLSNWYKVVVESDFLTFSGVRRTFNSADQVHGFVVFNVNSNRIITAIHYNRSKVYIRHVLTHSEYEQWTKAMRGSK